MAYPLAFLSRGREPSINFPSVSAAGKTAQHPPPTKLISEPIFVSPTVTNILFLLVIIVSDRSLGENSVVLVISGANSTTQGLAEAVAELARQKVLFSTSFSSSSRTNILSCVIPLDRKLAELSDLLRSHIYIYTCVHAFCV